jgi:hypothetical protein
MAQLGAPWFALFTKYYLDDRMGRAEHVARLGMGEKKSA